MQQPPTECEVFAIGLEIVSVEVLEVVIVPVLQRDGGGLHIRLWVRQTDHRGKVGAATK
jgi:hypothetical protein